MPPVVDQDQAMPPRPGLQRYGSGPGLSASHGAAERAPCRPACALDELGLRHGDTAAQGRPRPARGCAPARSPAHSNTRSSDGHRRRRDRRPGGCRAGSPPDSGRAQRDRRRGRGAGSVWTTSPGSARPVTTATFPGRSEQSPIPGSLPGDGLYRCHGHSRMAHAIFGRLEGERCAVRSPARLGSGRERCTVGPCSTAPRPGRSEPCPCPSPGAAARGVVAVNG